MVEEVSAISKCILHQFSSNSRNQRKVLIGRTAVCTTQYVQDTDVVTTGQ